MTEATADLYDRLGDELESRSLQLLSLGGCTRFVGPVRTIRCHGANGLVKQVLATARDGCALVVDGGGSLNSALMGDLIAESAVANGWAGAVVHGAIRDSTEIASPVLGA